MERKTDSGTANHIVKNFAILLIELIAD